MKKLKSKIEKYLAPLITLTGIPLLIIMSKAYDPTNTHLRKSIFQRKIQKCLYGIKSIHISGKSKYLPCVKNYESPSSFKIFHDLSIVVTGQELFKAVNRYQKQFNEFPPKTEMAKIILNDMFKKIYSLENKLYFRMKNEIESEEILLKFRYKNLYFPLMYIFIAISIIYSLLHWRKTRLNFKINNTFGDGKRLISNLDEYSKTLQNYMELHGNKKWGDYFNKSIYNIWNKELNNIKFNKINGSIEEKFALKKEDEGIPLEPIISKSKEQLEKMETYKNYVILTNVAKELRINTRPYSIEQLVINLWCYYFQETQIGLVIFKAQKVELKEGNYVKMECFSPQIPKQENKSFNHINAIKFLINNLKGHIRLSNVYHKAKLQGHKTSIWIPLEHPAHAKIEGQGLRATS